MEIDINARKLRPMYLYLVSNCNLHEAEWKYHKVYVHYDLSGLYISLRDGTRISLKELGIV